MNDWPRKGAALSHVRSLQEGVSAVCVGKYGIHQGGLIAEGLVRLQRPKRGLVQRLRDAGGFWGQGVEVQAQPQGMLENIRTPVSSQLVPKNQRRDAGVAFVPLLGDLVQNSLEDVGVQVVRIIPAEIPRSRVTRFPDYLLHGEFDRCHVALSKSPLDDEVLLLEEGLELHAKADHPAEHLCSRPLIRQGLAGPPAQLLAVS